MSFRRRRSTVINRTVYQTNLVNSLSSPHGNEIAPILSFGRQNPPGSIIAYTKATAPVGWLVCDGAAVNRFIYKALFDVIGETFGSGDGQFTFNLPDYRGAFLRGSGTANGFTGPATNSSQTDATRSHTHTHTLNDPGHKHSQRSINDDFNDSGGNNYPAPPAEQIPSFAKYDSAGSMIWDNINTSNTGISLTINNTGGVETRPYNYGVVWLIKY
jgi:hypothetical protein